MKNGHTFLLSLLDNVASIGCGLFVLLYQHSSQMPSALPDVSMRYSLGDILVGLFAMTVSRLAFTIIRVDKERHHSMRVLSAFLQILLISFAFSLLLQAMLLRVHGSSFRNRTYMLTVGAMTVYQAFRLIVFGRRLPWTHCEPAKVLILGSGKRAMSAWREIRTLHKHERMVLGFIADRPLNEMPRDILAQCVCTLDGFSAYLLNHVVDEVIVALPMRSCYDIAQQAILVANQAGVQSLVLTDLFFLPHGKAERLDAPAFVHLSPLDRHLLIAASLKRSLDIIGALLGILLLLPIFLITAVAVKVSSAGPVFFVQPRFGHRRRIFNMYKFRSMVLDAPALMTKLEAFNEADGPIFKMANDPRVTSIGRVLRQTSIDELPQLLNVLKGHKSLVGPLPMSLRDVGLFTDAQLMRRFCAKPGMTGIWQVAGRSSAGFDQWIKHDFHYLDNWSLLLDIKILVRTIPAVLKRSGAV